jgi:hypothetical protein
LAGTGSPRLGSWHATEVEWRNRTEDVLFNSLRSEGIGTTVTVRGKEDQT